MNSSTYIEHLRVANWPGTRGSDLPPSLLRSSLGNRGMVLNTCLRQLWVAVEPANHGTVLPLEQLPRRPELHFGTAAYRFLLEVTTGLRSSVPGETNVFGQFKKAWEDFRRDGKPLEVNRLAPLMHQLINDSRCIRRRYLEGIGGSSYGTLVRRLISPRRGDRVLFVGAGNLARSMLPYFAHFQVGIWNHRPINPAEFSVDRFFTPEQAGAAAMWADHVILTTPPDNTNDADWRRRLQRSENKTLVHLGHRKGELETWPHRAAVYDLDDVFALDRQQAGIRSHRLDLARRACRTAARAVTEERAELPLTGPVHA